MGFQTFVIEAGNLRIPFLTQFAAAGFPPETIDLVVCTHLHVDHVGWNTRLDIDSFAQSHDALHVLAHHEFRTRKDGDLQPLLIKRTAP
jgi:glyoxylase-like metal-dependent hydrolase (beta-lactamase superfamily II)